MVNIHGLIVYLGREHERKVLAVLGLSLAVSLYSKTRWPEYYFWPDWILWVPAAVFVYGMVKLSAKYAVSRLRAYSEGDA